MKKSSKSSLKKRSLDISLQHTNEASYKFSKKKKKKKKKNFCTWPKKWLRVKGLRKLFDLRRRNQLYAISGHVKVVFLWKNCSFYAVLCLQGAFRNVTPCTNEKTLCMQWPKIFFAFSW